MGYKRIFVTATTAALTTVMLFGSVAQADSSPSNIPEQQALTDINDFHSDARYAAFYHQKLDWKKCFKQNDVQHECATLIAPKNWYDPTMGTIEIQLSRMLVDDKPLANPRLLLANPGGPGGSGAGFAGQMARLFNLTSTHTPVDIDPRGVGKSTHLDCGATPGTAGSKIGDSRGISAKAAAAAAKPWMKYFADCKTSSKDFLKYVNTDQTARDFNLTRAVLGFAKADYFGISYGTWLGAYLGKAFPQTFERIVLDSNMDWQKSQERQIQLDPGMTQEVVDRIHLPWLARHQGTYGVGSTAEEVNQIYELIRTAAGKGELAPITPDMVDMLLNSATIADDLHNVGSYLMILNKARLGDAKEKAELKKIAAKITEGYPTEEDSTYHAVVCGDSPLRRNQTSWYWATAVSYQDLPAALYMGEQTEMCEHWPYQPALDPKVVKRPLQALLMHNEVDPNTPYAGLSETLQDAKGKLPLVFVDNAFGHGSLDFSEAADYATSYFSTGTLIKTDVAVQAGPLPDESVSYEYRYSTARGKAVPRYLPYRERDLTMPPAIKETPQPKLQSVERQKLVNEIHQTLKRSHR